MNQIDLETHLRKTQGLSKRKAERVLDAVLDGIRQELHKAKIVRLRNFGTFSVRAYQAKIFQDIHGKVRTLPDRKKVFFKQSKNIFNPR